MKLAKLKEALESHACHDCLHLAYLGMVFMETGYYYGYIAGTLFVVTLSQQTTHIRERKK
jgi:hypothetical protein